MDIKKFIKNITKETWIKIIIYVSIVLVGFALDRISKVIVAANLELNVLKQVTLIPNLLYFSYVENTGGAWSILSNATWLLAIISTVAVIGISYYMFKKQLGLNYFICCALIVAGGLGNLFDRVIYGAVVDFIETYPLGYSFPIFNIADILVVVGSFYMIIYMFIEDHRNKKASQERILTEEELIDRDENNGRSE